MISIAMTTYNGECYIQEQLDSIIAQRMANWELVICDDCSSDNTWLILQEYSQKDGRVKIFRNEKNLGFKRNFEKAISFCTGEYIALCDQDDVWSENHLSILLQNIGCHDLICANALYIDSSGNTTGLSVKRTGFYVSENKNEQFFQLFFQNYVQGCTCLFKKCLVEKIIPIPDEYQFHDWWIAVVAAMNGGAYYIDEKIVNYRIHSKSITNSNNRNCFSALKNKLKNSRAYYRDILNVHNYLNCIELDESQKMYKRKAEKIISCFSTWKQRFLCLHEYIQNWQLICFDSNSLKFPFYFAKKILLCC